VTDAGRIEALITELVRAAPVCAPAVVDELTGELRGIGAPVAQPLARSIARVVELVAEQLVDPGIALPALAMACATLADGLCGRLGERELEAARYEIETLMPLPEPRRRLIVIDVPVIDVRRRS